MSCEEGDDPVLISITPKKKRRTVPPLEEEDDTDNRDEDHLDCDFSSNLAGAAPSSSVTISPENNGESSADHQDVDNVPDLDARNPNRDYTVGSDDHQPIQSTDIAAQPRRSTRLRKPPTRLAMAASSKRNTTSDESEGTDRLEQIDCVSPRDFGLPEGHPACRLRIIMHPVAMALISLHAHLTRTEVIGYLGGGIRRSACGDVDVLIAEAFPAQGICDRALAKSGRNAFAEVEIDPESSVEVMTRLTDKKLQVVGWYHSHPDASFSVEPSRVDIENQQNYQKFIFKDAPFVAGIIAPYNEDLPDHMPDMRFFQVHDGATPLKLPFSVGSMGSDSLQEYMYGDHRYPIDDFVTESLALVAAYSQFPKRVRLDHDWREGVDGVDKLKRVLFDIVQGVAAAAAPAATTNNDNNADNDTGSDTSNKKLFLDSVQLIIGHIERQWKESGQLDDERLSRNREAAARRKRRTRR